MKRSTLLSIFLLITTISIAAEVRQTREEYIDRYANIAVAHMERYGIPASITMAQGILESDSGNSHLSRSSNNHFGIKCKSDWKGRKVFHDDDAPQECFRAYPTVELSYQDHADFLDSSPRYDSLFNYSSSDYKSWARGLKAAGYATASDYAPRLIKIIEDYKLYLLDSESGMRDYAMRFKNGGVSSTTATATAIDPNNFRVTINAYHGYNIYRTNGVAYILAKSHDSIEHLAEIFSLSKGTLRRFNDMERNATLREGEMVFIERKKGEWGGNAREHIVHDDETLHHVAQSYAIRLKSLRRINDLPRKGCTLEKNMKLKIQ